MMDCRSFLIFILCGCVFCDKCVTNDFEGDLDEFFDSNSVICAVGPMWNRGNYSSIDIESPHPLSTTFIYPNPELSCMSTIPFQMSLSGVIELNFYMDPVLMTDQLTVIVNQVAPGGNDMVVGDALVMMGPNFVSGWQSIRIALRGYETYSAYVTLLATASPNALIIVDSLRYIPPSYNEDECRVYEDIPTTISTTETVTETPTTTALTTQSESPTIRETTTTSFETSTESSTITYSDSTTDYTTTEKSNTTTVTDTTTETDTTISDRSTESDITTKTTITTEIEEPTTSSWPTTAIYTSTESETTTDSEATTTSEMTTASSTTTQSKTTTEFSTPTDMETTTESEAVTESDTTTEPMETTGFTITTQSEESTISTKTTTDSSITTETQTSYSETTPITYASTDSDTTTELTVTTPCHTTSDTETTQTEVYYTETTAMPPLNPKGFWNVFTISMVILLTIILITVVAVVSYYIGRSRRKRHREDLEMYLEFDDSSRPISIPRVSTVYTKTISRFFTNIF